MGQNPKTPLKCVWLGNFKPNLLKYYNSSKMKLIMYTYQISNCNWYCEQPFGWSNSDIQDWL